jgi:cobalt transport protein ATP-binding subunit
MSERDVHVHPHAHDIHEHAHPRDEPHPHETSPAIERLPGSIEISHLHFRYPDGFEALRGIDLEVKPSDKVAFVGPNGAGKSTLLMHLNGIVLPTHGTIRVSGTAIDRETMKRVRADVGLVFQDPDDQLFSATVYDDVAYGPTHMGLSDAEIHERVERALSAVGMRGSERRPPHHLSLGQRKRVALATVLSMDPSILVFDEPSAGLDPRGRRELISLLKRLAQTVIVATHDMRLVAEVLDRTVILDGGLVVGDGPSSEILADNALLERHGLEAP